MEFDKDNKKGVPKMGNPPVPPVKQDTLFKTVENLVLLGFEVSFRSQPLNLEISLSKPTDKYNQDSRKVSHDSWLPLSDHFYEQRVIDCIKFMQDKIQTEIDTLNKK